MEKSIPIDVFKEAGKKGGETTTKRYSKKQRREWGKLGGRPKKIDPNLTKHPE